MIYNNIIKKILYEKYDITITSFYVIDEYYTYYRMRCDYWTNDLKYFKGQVYFLYKQDLLKAIRKEKLNNINLEIE